MESTFKIGDRVTHPGFADCFGKHVPTTTGLTVTDVQLVKGTSIPDYFRITARDGVDTNGVRWGMWEAAERFFILERA